MSGNTILLREYTGDGIEGSNPFLSATCPHESVLPIRPRPDFSLFSRVMREGLSTGLCARGPGSVLSGAILSGPVACANLVKNF
jgi:hypothetical protein